MHFQIDLSAAWVKFVSSGKIKNVFTDRQGKQVEAGLRVGEKGVEQYAVDVATGKNLNVSQPEYRPVGESGFEILYNPLGSLKPHSLPKRAGRQPDLAAELENCQLSCGNTENPLSISNRETLLETKLSNFQWRIIPNVAPWEIKGLLMWVRYEDAGEGKVLPHESQRLTREHLEDFLDIARSSSGMATYFNSLHGGASANHFHLQSSYCDRPMAVESADRMVVGEYAFLKNYPASGLVFPLGVLADQLWPVVEKIQTASFPLDLIALPSGIFLFVRNIDQEVVEEFPGRTFGGINFAGLFITSETDDLEKVKPEIISSIYGRMTIGGDSLAHLIEA